MPRKSKSNKRARSSQFDTSSASQTPSNQPSTSTDLLEDDHDDHEEQYNHPNPTLLEDANKVVRFIIIQGTEHKYVRNDFKFISSLKNLEEVLTQAEKILREVYGLVLSICDENPRTYIISSIFKEFDIQSDEEKDSDRVMLFLILSHILLSKKKVDQDSFYKFLKGIGIDVDTRHEDFGDVKDLIFKKFYKQGYIEITTNAISKISQFDWGKRAHLEIPKGDVLGLVRKIYADKKQ